MVARNPASSCSTLWLIRWNMSGTWRNGGFLFITLFLIFNRAQIILSRLLAGFYRFLLFGSPPPPPTSPSPFSLPLPASVSWNIGDVQEFLWWCHLISANIFFSRRVPRVFVSAVLSWTRFLGFTEFHSRRFIHSPRSRHKIRTATGMFVRTVNSAFSFNLL